VAIRSRGVPLKVSYKSDTIDVVNNGHTIQEIVHAQSSVKYDGREYHLVQFHFHSLSEHTINGKYRDLEMHLVHKDDREHLLVGGVFFQKGKKNGQLEPIIRHLPDKPGKHKMDVMAQVDVSSLVPKDSALFSYQGSLTTPPATEGLRWFVYPKPLSISEAQLKKFRALYDHNYRPVQPLNGRMLGLVRQRAKGSK
jgi:carbonic anhydrase